MTEQPRRHQLADELIHRFAAAIRGVQLYSPRHPLVARNIESLHATLSTMHVYDPQVTLGILDDEVVVGEAAVPRAFDTMGELVHRLERAGIERITIDRGVTTGELTTFAQRIAKTSRRASAEERPAADLDLPHIRVGRVEVEQRIEATVTDSAMVRRLYRDAVTVANTLWEGARLESGPDPAAARSMVDELADAVVQNRTALLALTALQQHDNYTFTHMVNVSILTMAQARGLGIDGALLREFGMAALMHDIGKVRIPSEILNKPDRLTDAEFAVMKRHTIEGAEILRRTPEIPTLAPVVAFEHHLRPDGTGYPEEVRRPALNLGTMLCSIADVYDAMRSERRYQESFASDRILAVYQRDCGSHFDQHLVRRFVQLLGIYPAGSLVRLDSNEVAVVLRIHAPDPWRPRVRIVLGADGRPLERPRETNLWEGTGELPTSGIVGSLDPGKYDLDPLSLMQ
jgi:putative nucleotidyltransferase with HDIG domain